VARAEAALTADPATIGPEAAPKPPGADEILAMMAARSANPQDGAARRRDTNAGLLGAIGFGSLAGLGVAALIILTRAADFSGPGVMAAAAVAIVASAVLIAAFAQHVFLRKGARSRRPQRLAGAEMLTALGLAEKMLDADEDARLLTRRDGVVVFANIAYRKLAEEAGVIGPAGLPPRVDRLFAQQGAEATKVFRLCRAAKSAIPAEEVIFQQIGLDGGGRRRRFQATVRPAPGADDYVAWRLRELPVEEETHDLLAASFADYVRPVFAIERSGQIAWSNAALRAELGLDRGAFHDLDGLVLGEASEVVRKIWQVDQAPIEATIRGRGGAPEAATFRAFRRGGVGEGFVCVELWLDAKKPADEEAPISGDLSESPFGVAVIEGEVGGDARIVEANRAFAEVFGGAKKNTPLARVFSAETIGELAAEIRRKSSAGGAPRPVDAVVEGGARSGAYAIYARPQRRKRGGYGGRRTVIYAADVSDRKLMEVEHRRDQKLASIGKFTGEIAHDFNNLLQIVIGNCEKLMLRHPAGDPDYIELGIIRGNALRGSTMIKKLLAFSGSQTLRRETVSITELLREWAEFLNRAVGDKVEVRLMNGRGLPPIRVDKSEFENALMNLAVNARDAMGPGGGKLTIRTSAIPSAEVAALGHQGLGAGEHLLIEISDTGPGVAKEIRDRIFEPFFTTKGEGKGTGLGLASVYGVITQLGGAITVGDAEGGGALFRIYLPAHEGPVEALPPAPAHEGPVDLTGVGRILVVEDEEAVRTFVVRALEDCGYEVTTVENAEEGLELIGEDPKGFDLVVSDVMMPDIDGPTLISRARSEHGLSARVLFMSAYAETTVRDQIDSLDDVAYIQKPFTLKGLAAKVKQAIRVGEDAKAA
jgi:two-component system cell cycle sensor histidine kinase/response regulator CckA